MRIDFEGVITIVAIAKFVVEYPELTTVEVANKVCNAMSFLAEVSKEDKDEFTRKTEALKDFIDILKIQ